MKKSVFKGAGVALVTPMKDDGSVNFAKVDELVDMQLEGGTDAIIAVGTTGEASTLSREDHIKVVDAVVRRVNGRIPVIAGSGSNDTAFALETSRQAQAVGADGLLMVTPYYNKTSQAGLIKHFTLIADSVDLPIILYNVPSRTGTCFKSETYAVLADHPNICGIKEASGDLSAAAKTFALCGDKVAIYSGNDDQIVPFLSLGGDGVISVLSNVAPRAVHDMCYKFWQGDVEGSRKLQLDNIALVNALFSDVNPIPVKEAMNMMGLDVGPCRLPLVPMGDDARENLRKQLLATGLI